MSRASTVRLLLACALGALIGGAWSAIDDGRPFVGYVLTGVLVLAAYVTAWGLGDES